MTYEGRNDQRHAAVRGRALRALRGGLHPRPRAPPRGGQVAGPIALRRLVLRLARRHRGRQAAREADPRREDLLGKAGARQRPRRLPAASRRSSRGERWDRLRAAGAPRAAPAVGVDRRQGPRLPGHDVRRRAHRARTPSTRCRWRRSWPRPSARTSRPGTAASRPGRGPGGARRRPASTSTTSPTKLLQGRRRRSSSTPMEKLLAGIEEKREAIVTRRPPTISASIPDGLEPKVASRIDQAVAGRRRAADLEARTPTLWGPAGQPEVADRLGWLTVAEQMLEGLDDLLAFAQEVRDGGVTDVVLLGHGRLVAGARGPAPVVRAAGGLAHPARAGLDRPRRDRARVEAAIDPATTLFLVVDEVRRDDRDAVALRALLGAGGRTASAFVAITDPGSGAAEARLRARLPPRRSSTTPTSAAATARCRTSGSCPRRSWAPTSRALLDGAARCRAGLSRVVRPRHANSGLWLGCALGELARAGPRQAHVRRRRAAGVVRPLGRAARRRVDRQAGPRDPAGRRRAARRAGRLRRRPRLRAPARRDAPDEEHDARRRGAARRRPPGPRRSPRTGREDLGRVFFFAEFATAVAGLGARDQPVRPAQRAGGQGHDEARPGPPDLGRGLQEPPDASDDDLRALVGGAGAAGLRRDPGLPARRRDEFDAAVAELRAAIRDAHEGDDDVRLRAALPALDGPVPQGRPARRAASCSSSTTPVDDVEIPGARTRSTHAQARPGDRRPADAARARAAGGEASRWTATTRPGRCATSPSDQGELF